MTEVKEITSETVVEAFMEQASEHAARFDLTAPSRALVYRQLECEVASENEVLASTCGDPIVQEIEVVMDKVCLQLGIEAEYVHQGGGKELIWWYRVGA